MTHVPSETSEGLDDSGKNERRDFMKGVATVGLLGAAGLGTALAQSSPSSSSAEDPKAPAGLRKGGQPDCRFPVSFESSVPESTRVLMQYYTALNKRDLAAMAETLHYPFVSYEGTDCVVVESREQFMSTPPASMNVTGKGDHFIRSGSYDIMEGYQLYIYGPVGAGFSLDYTRYDARGKELIYCNGLYGITNNDGKWGIEYMSTIIQPADQRLETYDADNVLKVMHDNQRDHALARKENQPDRLRRTIAFAGKWASVTMGGSNATSGPAAEGRAMEPYRVKGVKSRLRVTETTQESLDHPPARTTSQGSQNMAQFYALSGGGVGKWYQSLEFPGRKNNGGHVIYASTDKGHVYMGYSRYTQDGTLISETRYIGAFLYKNGVWVGSDVTATFGQVMYRDRTNDDLT